MSGRFERLRIFEWRDKYGSQVGKKPNLFFEPFFLGDVDHCHTISHRYSAMVPHRFGDHPQNAASCSLENKIQVAGATSLLFDASLHVSLELTCTCAWRERPKRLAGQLLPWDCQEGRGGKIDLVDVTFGIGCA